MKTEGFELAINQHKHRYKIGSGECMECGEEEAPTRLTGAQTAHLSRQLVTQLNELIGQAYDAGIWIMLDVEGEMLSDSRPFPRARLRATVLEHWR